MAGLTVVVDAVVEGLVVELVSGVLVGGEHGGGVRLRGVRPANHTLKQGIVRCGKHDCRRQWLSNWRECSVQHGH